MPSYTFSCKKCGEFTLWFQHMRGTRQEVQCPECSEAAKRVFKPPITFNMDSRVKKRIEKGMEPRVVNKKDLPKNTKRNPTISRPWQAGH
ncbi:zinc ribbon domain-containing protein [Lentibacillus salinarum]|uniref:Zinc ribbon domain-containing protein n=1 Tax=Lentibacillus salinarum TaxID=446820 RepID=A0ABW3ZTZ1_9BACI